MGALASMLFAAQVVGDEMPTYKGRVNLPNGLSQEVTVQADLSFQAIGMLEAQYGRGNLWGAVNEISPARGADVPLTSALSSGRDTGLGILILLLAGVVYYLTTLPWQWVAAGAAVLVVGVVVLVRRMRRKTQLHRGKIVDDALRQDFALPAAVGPLEDVAGPVKDEVSAFEDAVALRKDFAAPAA